VFRRKEGAEVPQNGIFASWKEIAAGDGDEGRACDERTGLLFQRGCSRFDSEHDSLERLQAVYVIKRSYVE
jgi:hypothetical protein